MGGSYARASHDVAGGVFTRAIGDSAVARMLPWPAMRLGELTTGRSGRAVRERQGERRARVQCGGTYRGGQCNRLLDRVGLADLGPLVEPGHRTPVDIATMATSRVGGHPLRPARRFPCDRCGGNWLVSRTDLAAEYKRVVNLGNYVIVLPLR